MELYKTTKGYNYSVSNLGNVKNNKTGLILKQFSRSKTCRYLSVNLCNKGKMKTFSVHQLILKAFIENPNPELYNQIDHIDNNKLNNNLSNLRWCSHSQNNRNKYSSRNKKGCITIQKDGRKKKYRFQYNLNYKQTYKSFFTLREAQIAQKYYKAFIPLIEWKLDR